MKELTKQQNSLLKRWEETEERFSSFIFDVRLNGEERNKISEIIKEERKIATELFNELYK